MRCSCRLVPLYVKHYALHDSPAWPQTASLPSLWLPAWTRGINVGNKINSMGVPTPAATQSRVTPATAVATALPATEPCRVARP